MSDHAPRPGLQERPPLLDRLLFWALAGLFVLGVLKLERDIEE